MYIRRLSSIISIILLTLISFSCNKKGKEFKNIFGQKYTEAENYINSNKWINDTIAKYGINPNLAIAIVFPELIRYSAIKDLAEIRSLEVLYTQYGSKYADFSIGRFQMKPTFALQLEKDWNLLVYKTNFKSGIRPFDLDDNPKIRMNRILRLKDEKWQVRYLLMFLIIVEEKHKINWDNSEGKVYFIASAYNSGYTNDSTIIIKKGKQNFFHTGILKPSRCYNYAEISEYYFKKIAGNNSGN